MSTNNEKDKEIKTEELPELGKQPEITTLSDGDGEDSGPNPGTPPPKPPIPPNP